MGFLLLLKVLFLFVAIWFGLAYVGRLIHHQLVSKQYYLNCRNL